MDTSSPSSNTKLATAKTILSAAASVATAVMLARSVTRDLLPYEIQDYFSIRFRKFYNHFSSQLTLFIDEVDGLAKNQIYEAAQIYLGSKNSTSSHSLRVSKHEKEDKMNVTIGSNEEVIDIFNGIKYKWVLVSRQIESQSLYNYSSTVQSEVRHFELSFPKKYKDVVLGSYLPYIEQVAKSLKQKSKAIKIFTVDHNNIIYRNWAEAWIPVNLDHPATFETLAMEPDQKKTILQDLERFVKRKDYYRKVGKAWKRGYLLYGPPGTGKSSLIAAIANYLKFDVYDLELSEVRSNSELRALLVATTNRSILVVEDIDCTIELQDRLAAETGNDGDLQKREVTVTLSGFLNFIDGLWSSCGDERIIVFTTNHKDKLDPALLRPGRMDVHVHMSYCTPSAFRVLAQNYLNLEIQQCHCLFEEIEELIGATKVTPAEVAEQLMRKDEPELALSALIEFLNIKKKEINDQEENAKNIIQEA